MIRVMQRGNMKNWRVFFAIDFFSDRVGYFLLLKDFNSLFPSCNCFTRTRKNGFFIIRNSFVAVIIQATYAKIDSFSALPSRPKNPKKHNPLLDGFVGWNIQYFHIMWRGQNIRNIHTMIKYLTLPLATADYDQHLVFSFSHVFYFFRPFFSNVQRNKTLVISILMKYSTETPTTMSDKVSAD